MSTFPRLKVGTVARQAEVSESLVRLYAKLGLIPCETDSNGARLFFDDAPARVREIRASRMSNRGRTAA